MSQLNKIKKTMITMQWLQWSIKSHQYDTLLLQSLHKEMNLKKMWI